MGTIKSFEEIQAWQKARILTKEVYDITKLTPSSKDFGLRDQIRRASVSVMSNIAEGFERGGTKEFVQFLSIGKGSAGEVRSQLYVALDQGYINDGKFRNFVDLTTEVSSMIGGFMNYLRTSNIRGTKYKQL